MCCPNCNASTNDDDATHDADETDAPWISTWCVLALWICESAEAHICKYEAFSCRTCDRNSNTTHNLALGREVVPRVVSHCDSASEKSNDTRLTTGFRYEIRNESYDHNQESLRYCTVTEEPTVFEKQAAKYPCDEPNQHRYNSKHQEVTSYWKRRERSEVKIGFEALYGIEEDYTYDVVEDAFTVDNWEKLGLIMVINHSNCSDDVAGTE